jgi:hypothetical protein
MRATIVALVSCVVSWAGFALADEPKSEKAASGAASDLKTIQKEADRALANAVAGIREGKTEEEIGKVKDAFSSTLASLQRRALSLADQHRGEPMAFEALVWVVKNRGPVRQSLEVSSALQALSRDYPGSDRIGDVCAALADLDSPEAEALLRGVVAVNASRIIRGRALFNLAIVLQHRADSQGGSEPQQAARWLQDAEQALEQVTATYGDVKVGKSTLAEHSHDLRDEIRHLSVGKAAPEIQGEDADGKKFKLSDYKGKVVLLDFWAGW